MLTCLLILSFPYWELYFSIKEADSCIEARLKAQEELARGGAREIQEQRDRAKARAEKEGRDFDEVLFEEGRARYEAYWAEQRKLTQTPPKGET